MKKYIFTLLFLLCINSIFAVTNAPIKLISTTPANGANLFTIKELSFTFDFTDVYKAHPNVSQEKWGIVAYMNSLDNLGIKLYKGTDQTGTPIATCYKSIEYITSDFKPGQNTIQRELNKEITLTPGEKYTLVIDGGIFNAATKDFDYYETTAISDPIILTFTGATSELPNIIIDSYLPQETTPIEILNDLTVKFKYKEGYGMKVADGATAYLRESGQEDIPATSITVDETDNTSVKFNFNNTTLYNGHTYSVVIPANSVYPIDPSTQKALTDKGNKEITLSGYKGASYNYIGLLDRGGVYPKNGSEISYLSTVSLTFDFGNAEYSINRQTIPVIKLYEGNKTTGTLINTYKCDKGDATAQIWKFDLKPSTTYTFVMEKGTLKITKPISSSSTGSMEVPDVTNEEIVVTYTTPATLVPVKKIAFASSVPAENAEVEKLEDVTLTFAAYKFEDSKFYPVKTGAQELKATFSEVTSGGNATPAQEVTLEVSEQSPTIYVAKATVGRNLYEGKTYRLVVPAGYFRPSEARLPESAANDEFVLTLHGKASHYGLTGTSSITADANMESLGVAAFYFNDNVTVAPEAKAKLYKGEATEAVAEVAVNAVTGMPGAVYADFCNDAHAPYTLEAGAAYRIELPQGAVASEADTEMMNGAISVAFNGPAVAEYVNVSYITENTTSKTQVVKGNTASYTFALETGWAIAGLQFNGTDVFNRIEQDGTSYTTPSLDADATVALTLKYTGSTYTEGPGSDVITPEGTSLKAYSSDGDVIIEGLTADTDVVTVYSMGGAVLQHFTATNKSATITLPADTYYLVKVNEVMMKILNKQ